MVIGNTGFNDIDADDTEVITGDTCWGVIGPR